jgi:type II secretory pathway pseudopilin PulG
MDIDKRNRLLSIVLGIIIVVLGYYLYHSIVDPYQEVIEREQMTQKVRTQMGTIRDALVQYERTKDNFPPTQGGLDSLVKFLKTDSAMVAKGDSLFKQVYPSGTYNPDSLIFSPRPPHPKFEYTLNDTLRPQIYLLKDPATDDKVGSLEKTTLLNSGSWE